jgi:hypothetical protein
LPKVSDVDTRNAAPSTTRLPGQPGFRPTVGPGYGRMHRLVCQAFNRRPILLLSDCELATFLYLYRQDSVIDVESQKLCDLDVTRRISLELGIRHPAHKGEDSPLRTDLVAVHEIDGVRRSEALSVKHHQFWPATRKLELMLLEKRYYEDMGIAWADVRSRGLNSFWARNLFWLFQTAESAVRDGYSDGQLDAHARFLEGMHRWRWERSVSDLCVRLSTTGTMARVEAATAFRELLSIRYLDTDLNVPRLHETHPSTYQTNGYGALNARRRRLGRPRIENPHVMKSARQRGD